MNIAFTSQEAVTEAFIQVDQLMKDGACESCAVRMVANRSGTDFGRLMTLYCDRLVELYTRHDAPE